jgi:hypothetical protein
VRRDELLTLAGEHPEDEPVDRRAASSQPSRAATRLWGRLAGFLATASPRRGRFRVGQLQAGEPPLIRVAQDGSR